MVSYDWTNIRITGIKLTSLKILIFSYDIFLHNRVSHFQLHKNLQHNLNTNIHLIIQTLLFHKLIEILNRMHFIIKSLVHSKNSEIWYKNKRTYLGGQVERNIQRRARVRRHFVSEQGSELIQGTGPSRPGWRQLKIHPEDTTIVQPDCVSIKKKKRK